MVARRGSLEQIKSVDNRGLATSIRSLIEGVLPEWYSDALCAQTDPDGYFPEKGGSAAAVKKMCRERCAVRDQCLDFAMDNGEIFGIWGGTSPKERRAIGGPNWPMNGRGTAVAS